MYQWRAHNSSIKALPTLQKFTYLKIQYKRLGSIKVRSQVVAAKTFLSRDIYKQSPLVNTNSYTYGALLLLCLYVYIRSSNALL